MATIPSWGPTYKVSFDFYINKFDVNGPGGWGELLRFTSTEKNCCGLGDRIPAIFTNKNGHYVYPTTQIDKSGDRWKAVKGVNGAKKIEEKKWYKLELTQYKEVDWKQDKIRVTLIID